MSAGIKCTWDGCHNWAARVQVAKDGQQWANLCEKHDRQLNSGISNGDAKAIFGAWVAAQGGSKKTATRIVVNAAASWTDK